VGIAGYKSCGICAIIPFRRAIRLSTEPVGQVFPADDSQQAFSLPIKRDFTKTVEPSGTARVRPAEYRRFVIQKHAASRLHYDLRLEVDGVFKSWAVTKGPSLDPRDRRLAVEVEDHPLDYGDFEGTIPQREYGGGTVMLWDRGFWVTDDGGDPQPALRKGELKFTLAGEKLQGSWVLVRMRNDRERGRSQRNNWLLIKHRDGPEREAGEPVTDQDRSVASGRAMEQIAAGKVRRPKPFMLAGKATASDAVSHSNRNGKVNTASFLQTIELPKSQLRLSEAARIDRAAVHYAPSSAGVPAALLSVLVGCMRSSSMVTACNSGPSGCFQRPPAGQAGQSGARPGVRRLRLALPVGRSCRAAPVRDAGAPGSETWIHRIVAKLIVLDEVPDHIDAKTINAAPQPETNDFVHWARTCGLRQSGCAARKA
jgi:DNA ligase D-like protein (predicted 3'-phosphoesterase)